MKSLDSIVEFGRNFWDDRYAIAQRLFYPPQFTPRYDGLRYASEDQHTLRVGQYMPISDEARQRVSETVVEKYRELTDETVRRVDRDLRLVDNSQKLFANAIQYGLVAAGIVASLGAWLNLQFVALPLTTFILSISTAWWYLCKEPPDFSRVSELWAQQMPSEFEGTTRPDNFRKEMFPYFYESNYSVAVREYRQWLHRRLAVPAGLFVSGLVLLLLCVSASAPLP